MLCPSCTQEIPDDVGICPECTQELTRVYDAASDGSVGGPRVGPGSGPGPGSGSGAGSGSGSGGFGHRADDGAFEAGTLVNERYRIVRLLGRGGMGEVYQADDLTLGVRVALKFLSPTLRDDQDKLELFLNEVRLAREITHPNVCRVFDVASVDGRYFLTMEMIDGEDLSSLMKRVGRLAVERAVEIGVELCRGLQAAHERGILHCDLKPANLMIDGAGRARITDFGLAALAGTADRAGVVAGTLEYMAPESVRGETSVASDLYCLGMVLYELLGGGKPFVRPQVLRHESPDLPKPLEARDVEPQVAEVVTRCLAPQPGDRPASAAEVAKVFARSAAPTWEPLAGQPIPQRSNWRLTERLGRGGFGEAWLATHSKTGRRRVFKFCQDAAKLRSFERETTLFRLLTTKLGERDDIVRLLDWNLDEPPYFIEAEYAAGGNLRQWVHRREEADAGSVPLALRLDLAAQVASALAAAHSVGVIHKDVKPSNVLIQEVGSEPKVRLCDFGIGAPERQEILEAAGITLVDPTDSRSSGSSYAGTRLYMAPEVLEGREATVHSDVYSFGVLLYQLVVGDFSRALAPGWRREVEDELLQADIAAAVERAPDARPGCGRLAQRLRTLDVRREELEAERRLAREAEETRHALARADRRRGLVATGVGFLIALALVLAYAFEKGSETASRALIEQTLRSHDGMASIAASAIGRNLTAVQRRLEREAERPDLARILSALDTTSDADTARAALQPILEEMYARYRDRSFYSWVVTDRDAVIHSRAPFDGGVVGNRYAYREWFTGTPQPPADQLDAERRATMPALPRDDTGLTLAFKSTAEGNPILMSVAAPVRSEDDAVLGVLSASLHLETFNDWLKVAEVADTHRADSLGADGDDTNGDDTDGNDTATDTDDAAETGACPERYVVLLHRGQMVRHPCPAAGKEPPVAADDYASDALAALLEAGWSERFHDLARAGHGMDEDDDGELAVARRLPAHPDWHVLVIQDRGAALRPLTRLTDRLRLLGRLALASAVLLFVALVVPLLRRRRGTA